MYNQLSNDYFHMYMYSTYVCMYILKTLYEPW